MSGSAVGGPDPSLIGGHRVDIETLRAVAVIAVLLYHAGVPGFDGGYVGVDVFFALSGYLMTGLLAAEHRRSGKIRFGAFYARRARRLLPASALVLVLTTVASAVILAPLALKRVATDATWAGAYAVNLRFATEATDYLGADVAESPVLHYWSLAVEEQFYLVWPVLLALGLRSTSSYRRSVAVLLTMSLSSFVFAVWLTGDSQPWAFFSLPARAWEFGAGGLAVLLGGRLASAEPRLRAALVVLGLSAILAAVLTFDGTTRFPGPAAMLPVLGTVLVLVAGRGGRLDADGDRGLGSIVDRFLSSPFGQWVGGRSYAIYLWHWPPLVLAPAALGRSLSLGENVLVVVLASVAAVVAHAAVENPIRFAAWLRPPARSGGLAVVLTSTAIAIPAVIASNVSLSVSTGVTASAEFTVEDDDGARPLPVNVVPTLDDVGDDRPQASVDGCHVGQRTEEPQLPCVYGDVDASSTMVLFGDSHMVQWFPAFERFGREHGWKVVVLTKTGCPSLSISVMNENLGRPYTECDSWRQATIEAIASMEPEVVVLGNYPRGLGSDPTDPERAEPGDAWAKGLDDTVAALGSRVGQVVVLGPTPLPSASIPECVSGNMADTRSCDLVRAERSPAAENARQRSAAISAGARFVEVTDWFCGPTTCPSVAGPILVYRDASHISTPMAGSLVDRLAAALEQLGIT